MSNLNCDTWHDILIKRGFDSKDAKSLIGFICWNRDEEFAKLGTEITEILSGYEGKVFAKDSISSSYGDKALLFFSEDIVEDTANEMFDCIMDYEQNEVYSTEEAINAFYNS